PDPPQPLCDFGHCSTSRCNHANRRCIQSRTVRHPYDYFVLHRNLRELYSGTTSRKTALPVGNILQVVPDRLSRISRGGMGGKCLLRISLCVSVALFRSIIRQIGCVGKV